MKFKKVFLLLLSVLLVGCYENKTVNESKFNDVSSTTIITQIKTTEFATEEVTEEYYDIPELTGMPYEEAKSILENFGMVVECKKDFSDDIPVGHVIKYPHRKYNENKKEICLTISKGKAIFISNELLSNTKDKTIAEKIQIIEDAGIKTEIEYETNNIDWYNITDPQEMIIDIEPYKAAKGDTVKISVVKPPIQITDAKLEFDSVGGCSIPFTLKNLTDKQIAYIDIDFYFYNTMGDPAYCNIKNQYIRRLRMTGPIDAGEEIPYSTEPLIYNSTVGAVFPKLIIIEYADGNITAINNVAYWKNGLFYGGQLKD